MYIEKCPSFHRNISGHGESMPICDIKRYLGLYNPDCENCSIGDQYRSNNNETVDAIKKIPMRA